MMIAEALIDKYGWANGLIIENDKVKTWPEDWPKQPTQKEIKVINDEYEAKLESLEYQKLRAEEYPLIGDQLDAIMKWVAGENKITVSDELKSIAMECMSVKAKHPKP